MLTLYSLIVSPTQMPFASFASMVNLVTDSCIFLCGHECECELCEFATTDLFRILWSHIPTFDPPYCSAWLCLSLAMGQTHSGSYPSFPKCFEPSIYSIQAAVTLANPASAFLPPENNVRSTPIKRSASRTQTGVVGLGDIPDS
jgi:hypothetical protein